MKVATPTLDLTSHGPVTHDGEIYINTQTTMEGNGTDKTMTKHSNTKRIYDCWNLVDWNVRGLNNKLEEVTQELNKFEIDVTMLSETKKKGKGSIELENHLLLYSGADHSRRAALGISIIIKKNWKRKIISYSWINDRIITLKFKIGRKNITLIGVYAPTIGHVSCNPHKAIRTLGVNNELGSGMLLEPLLNLTPTRLL